MNTDTLKIEAYSFVYKGKHNLLPNDNVGKWEGWEPLVRLIDVQTKVMEPYIPDGYKLVPIEATHEMLAAAFVGKVETQDVTGQIKRREKMAEDYYKMVMASPFVNLNPKQETFGWKAFYIGKDGYLHTYTTSDYASAVEKDMDGKPHPLIYATID